MVARSASRQDPAAGRGHIGWCDCGCCRRRARHGDDPCTDADRNQGARSHDHDRRPWPQSPVCDWRRLLRADCRRRDPLVRSAATQHPAATVPVRRARNEPDVNAAADAGRGDAASACAGRIRAAVGTFICAGDIAVSGRTASSATRRNATAGSFGSSDERTGRRYRAECRGSETADACAAGCKARHADDGRCRDRGNQGRWPWRESADRHSEPGGRGRARCAQRPAGDIRSCDGDSDGASCAERVACLTGHAVTLATCRRFPSTTFA